MMFMMSFKQFVDYVDRTYHEHSFDLRYGQTVMNVLYKTWPEKYNEITNTDYDCFYDDGTVAMLLDKLNREWPSGH
jgi:hypothetical protein